MSLGVVNKGQIYCGLLGKSHLVLQQLYIVDD